MKKIALLFSAASLSLAAMTGCIKEIDPQTSTVTAGQAAAAPGAFDNFVSAITSTWAGYPGYTASRTSNISGSLSSFAYDFGYSAFWIARDYMGQDMVPATNGGTFANPYYSCGTELGPRYAKAQWPWTVYYKWISSCNNVISLCGEDPDESLYDGLGIAYASRAMYYMDLAQMYNQKAYSVDKSAETVPLVTEKTVDFAHNPRLTNAEMWEDFILPQLDIAEKYIANYKRSDTTTPDLSVVYGLKARAYLYVENWAEAEKYAKLAQQGYTPMTEAQYTSRETGFNTPNSSWMLSCGFRADDLCIIYNDGDSSWASWMCLELNHDPNGNGSNAGCGYAANYGYPTAIDRHLYETIPDTDFRKKCYIDFSVDELGTRAERLEALKEYSDYPEYLYDNAYTTSYSGRAGGLSLKFRLAGGAAGHESQYVGFVVQLPMMRVEEMMLIEAEAAGMQDEGRGRSLLTAFAQLRDPSYTYGSHTDAYNNTSTGLFRNECWWQRRVELWGEGFATYDIKRLNKGVIRSYENSNHVADYRWNTNEPPQWMALCFVSTEAANNYALNQNPTPVPPSGDSPAYIW